MAGLVLALAPTVGLTMISSPAVAQAPPAAGLEGLSGDEQQILARYDASMQDAAAVGAQIDALAPAIAAAEADLAAAGQRAVAAEAHLTDVQARIGQAERELAVEESRLQNKAIRAYIGGREDAARPVADVLASSGSLTELGSRVAYSQAVVEDQRSTVDKVTDKRDQVRSLKAEAEQTRATAAAERDDVAHRRDEVRSRSDALEGLRNQSLTRAGEVQGQVDVVVTRQEAYARRTAGARSGSDSIAHTLLARQYGQELPVPAVGTLSRPILGGQFSSGFGTRLDPISGESSRHEGIDVAAVIGTPILAAADGVVVSAGEISGYGQATVIDYGSGLATLYGHQSQILVANGQEVHRGDLVGLVGNTGKSTGPHLHLEVRVFGVPVDPRPYLAA